MLLDKVACAPLVFFFRSGQVLLAEMARPGQVLDPFPCVGQIGRPSLGPACEMGLNSPVCWMLLGEAVMVHMVYWESSPGR